MYSRPNLQTQTSVHNTALTSSAIIGTGSKTTNGSSSSTSKNLYANKLQLNRLQANALKVRNLKDDTSQESSQESFLYSLHLKNGNWTGTQLIFDKNEVDLITFSDRPFRYQKQTTDSEATNTLNTVFSEGGNNSFTEDPPNAVLSTTDGQEVFEINSFLVSNNIVTINLTALKNEGVLTPTIGAMNLFIDSSLNDGAYVYWAGVVINNTAEDGLPY